MNNNNKTLIFIDPLGILFIYVLTRYLKEIVHTQKTLLIMYVYSQLLQRILVCIFVTDITNVG